MGPGVKVRVSACPQLSCLLESQGWYRPCGVGVTTWDRAEASLCARWIVGARTSFIPLIPLGGLSVGVGLEVCEISISTRGGVNWTSSAKAAVISKELVEEGLDEGPGLV